MALVCPITHMEADEHGEFHESLSELTTSSVVASVVESESESELDDDEVAEGDAEARWMKTARFEWLRPGGGDAGEGGESGAPAWPLLPMHEVAYSEEDVAAWAADEAAFLEERKRVAMGEAILNAQTNFVVDVPPLNTFGALLSALLAITDSEYGFIGELVEVDGARALHTHAITNIAWNDAMHKYHNEQLEEKGGFLFTNLDTLFGAVLTTEQPVVANDPASDPRAGNQRPPGHPPLDRFLGIPFTHNGKLVGMAGVANRPVDYTDVLVDFLGAFVTTCSNLIVAFRTERQRYFAESELINMRKRLEREVDRRTARLRSQNAKLTAAIAQQTAMEREIKATSAAQIAFLAKMSHEIRTPLNGIIGMADLLALTGLTTQQRVYLRVIIASGSSLHRIVGDILDFTKYGSGMLELEDAPFSVLDLVEEAVQIVAPKAESRGLEVVVDIDADTPVELVGDSARLKQVLLNLLNNAIKFTSIGAVTLHTSYADGAFSVSVSDTGIGMSADEMANLFRPYYQATASTTRKYGGTGLGLAICKGLVEAMGGAIRVDSLVGAGSTFHIDNLPLAAPPTAPTLSAYLRDAGASGVRILVVEPGHLGATTAAYCRSMGMDVTAVESGMKALLALAKDAARADASVEPPFAFVLVSTELPDLRAPNLLQKFRALPTPPKASIIIIASYERLNVDWDSMCDATLVRPALPHHLVGAVTRFVSATVSTNTANLRSTASSFGTSRTWCQSVVQKSVTPFPEDTYRVLVIDDNATNLQISHLMLERLAISAHVVQSPVAACKMIESTHYDLVFVDSFMPHMSGADVIRTVRSNESGTGKHTVIVGMSGAVDADEQAPLFEAGMDGFVPKPLTFDALGNALAGHLVGYREKIDDLLCTFSSHPSSLGSSLGSSNGGANEDGYTSSSSSEPEVHVVTHASTWAPDAAAAWTAPAPPHPLAYSLSASRGTSSCGSNSYSRFGSQNDQTRSRSRSRGKDVHKTSSLLVKSHTARSASQDNRKRSPPDSGPSPPPPPPRTVSAPVVGATPSAASNVRLDELIALLREAQAQNAAASANSPSVWHMVAIASAVAVVAHVAATWAGLG